MRRNLAELYWLYEVLTEFTFRSQRTLKLSLKYFKQITVQAVYIYGTVVELSKYRQANE